MSHYLPELLEPPAGIPPEIFAAAVAVYREPRRLDMSALADALGVSRATLYRRVGSRDRLLGEVSWFLTRHLIVAAIEAAPPAGVDRVVGALEHYLRLVLAQPDYRRFVREEPEAAMRILTSPEGRVQPGIVAVLRRLLEVEIHAGRLSAEIDPAALAYTITRVCESFIYADLIGGAEPDVRRAGELVRGLIPAARVEVAA